MTAHLPRIKARLSIHAHRKVRGLLEGEYASSQLGRSMDLNDLREYVRGDDVRDLEWKASARTGQLLVKRFVATRKHNMLLVVSTGRSMAAANDENVTKRELAVFVAGVFGWLAVRHGDLVATAYGDASSCHVHPLSGREVKLERMLAAVHDATTPKSAPCALGDLLEHVSQAMRRRTIMVVVSDETAVDGRLSQALRRASVQHEVLFVTIDDFDQTRETRVALTDIDSGAAVPAWVRGDRRLADEYADLLAAEDAKLVTALNGLGIPHQRVTDHESALVAIFRLLERHRHGRHRA